MKRALALLLVLFAGSAFADELMRYTTPAERARGCVWADRFESQALVESNAGTITGAPTFSPVTGVTLDGAADYLTYNLTGQEFNSDPLSIVVEFTPDFNWDENANRYFFDADNGAGAGRSYIVKYNNAANNAIEVYLGNTSRVSNIAEGDYSPFWLQNQRNVMVVSSTTTNTNVWLNGSPIEVAYPVAWVPTGAVTRLVVGRAAGGGLYFDGTIHSLQVYKSLLTAAEAQDFYDHSTYTWENQATAHYQMRLVDHDATNTTTIDSAGNGYHLTFLGDFEANKLTDRHGYDPDGTNDYARAAAVRTAPAGDFSVVAYFAADNMAAGSKYVFYIGDGGDHGIGLNQYDHRFECDVHNGTDSSYVGAVANQIQQYQDHIVVFTYDYVGAANSIGVQYVDDWTPITETAMVGPVRSTSDDWSIGARYDGAVDYDGKVYEVIYFDGTILTPLQVEDIKITLKARRNQP